MTRLTSSTPRRWAVAGLAAVAVCVPASVVVAATTSPAPSPSVQQKYAVSKSSTFDESDAGKLAGAVASDLSTRSTDLGAAGPVTRVVSNPARTVWVGSASNGLCVIDLEANVKVPNGACYSSELILRGDAWQQAAGPDGFLLTALVPDDVTSVDVNYEGGAAATVAVKSNLVYSASKASVVGYSYTSGDRAFKVSVISG